MGYKESHLNLRGPGSIMEKLFNEAPGLIYEASFGRKDVKLGFIQDILLR